MKNKRSPFLSRTRPRTFRRNPGPSLWPTGIGYGDGGECRTPTHDMQQQGTRWIAKYASFLPPWRFLSRLHGRWCRADAALLLLERANLGAVGLAVDLRLSTFV